MGRNISEKQKMLEANDLEIRLSGVKIGLPVEAPFALGFFVGVSVGVLGAENEDLLQFAKTLTRTDKIPLTFEKVVEFYFSLAKCSREEFSEYLTLVINHGLECIALENGEISND